VFFDEPKILPHRPGFFVLCVGWVVEYPDPSSLVAPYALAMSRGSKERLLTCFSVIFPKASRVDVSRSVLMRGSLEGV